MHWATLGPHPSSWILSCADTQGKTSLHWGCNTPPRLQSILSKTWHSPHLRAFLGPDDSFMIWHPELIRWANLPVGLEDAIQSWLTPSGWRVGAPRLITWGRAGAFFAMSEYGNAVYGFGDKGGETWDRYKGVVEQWKAEKSFQWNGLTFITLDAANFDHFVAVRRDGIWAGSVEDENEDALNDFALNFWGRVKTKPKDDPNSNPGAGQSNAQNVTENKNVKEAKTDAKTQVLYETWAQETARIFASASLFLAGPQPTTLAYSNTSSLPPVLNRTPRSPPSLLTAFPYIPDALTTCTLTACTLLKADLDGMHACQHDVEKLLRGSGLYSYEWLRQERLRWHPDRFGRLCEERWREVGKRMAGEMFKILSALIDEVRKTEPQNT